MRMSTMMLSVVLLIAVAEGSVLAETVVLSDGFVSVTETIQVPAEEQGVLEKVNVKEGDVIQPGQPLAQIDEEQAQLQLAAALAEFDVAQEEASDRVAIEYAQATHKVTRIELRRAQLANSKQPGTVPEIDVERLKLKVIESNLQIDSSKMNFRIAALRVKVSQAKVDSALKLVKRCQIESPLEGIGVVVEQHRHQGEWVEAGEPIVGIVRLDKLHVEDYLSADMYAPSQVDGQPVIVEVTLAGGRTEKFRGKIDYVSPMVEAGGRRLVRAEVENRKENDYWLLSSGLSAVMTIQLKK